SRTAKAAPKRAAKKAAPKKAPKSPRATAAPRALKPPPNAVVHWEIQSQDPTALHRFYTEAFGWKIDADNPIQYGMDSAGGHKAIDGGIGGSPSPGSRVLIYATVPSIGSILERIEKLGGRTIMPRTDIGPVIMALYLDPEGNTMGLIEG